MSELHTLIEQYPDRLADALAARDEAAFVVEQLTARIRAEEWRLSAEHTDDIRLDHDLALLELDYDRLRGQIELAYRREARADKPSEAAIAAMVRADDQIVAAKRAILDKKHECAMHARRVGMMRHSATSPELERLRSELDAANTAYRVADRHVQEVNARLLAYQMVALFPESQMLAQLPERGEVAV